MGHFTTVPKSVYRGKVTWEHLVDDCGTVVKWRRSDPKPIILIKNDVILLKRHLFFIKNRLFFDAFWAKFPFAATLFVAATARQTPWIKAFREMCGSVAAFFQTFNYYAISAGCIPYSRFAWISAQKRTHRFTVSKTPFYHQRNGVSLVAKRPLTPCAQSMHKYSKTNVEQIWEWLRLPEKYYKKLPSMM